MLDPRLAHQWAHALTVLVTDVEQRVIFEIARSVAKDQGASWWDTNKLAQTAILRAKLLQHLGRPWQQVITQAQHVLDVAADAGQGMAHLDLTRLHYAHTLATVLPAQTMSGLAHITADTLRPLQQLPALILRDALDAYQTIMTVPVTSTTLGATTRRQATRDALNRFAARGLDSFTDKSGRRWRIDSYAEMATRTGALNALRLGYAHALTSAGLDLVHVTSHGYTCSKCAPWEGRVLSLTGHTPPGTHRVPSLTDDTWQSVTVHASIDHAKAEGLFHPNCSHSLAAWLPGASTPTRPQHDPATYEASQKQRALEREIRKEKRLLAASFTPQEATEHRRSIRAYQKNIRQLMAEHPKLVRKPWREANHKPGAHYAPAYERYRHPHGKTTHATTPARLSDNRYQDFAEFAQKAQAGRLTPGSVARGRLTFEHGAREQQKAHELITFDRLRDVGIDVRVNYRDDSIPGHKNPDVTLFGSHWEIKAPTGSSENSTIASQFRRGEKQATCLVIDLCRCGVSEPVALEQIERRFYGQKKLERVIILTKGGRALIFGSHHV